MNVEKDWGAVRLQDVMGCVPVTELIQVLSRADKWVSVAANKLACLAVSDVAVEIQVGEAGLVSVCRVVAGNTERGLGRRRNGGSRASAESDFGGGVCGAGGSDYQEGAHRGGA